MNFSEQFIQAVTAARIANRESNPQLLIPNIYNYEDSYFSNNQQTLELLHLLAGGVIKCNYIFSYS
ncbi:MAG: hypothetical protein ACTHKA_21525, partial [Anaerocolumna jejuensis]